MTTDIAPSLGAACLFTQTGVGTSPGYSAIDLRRALSPGLQEGAVSSGSYKVSQRGAGANLSVDVAAGTGLGALVLGDSVAAQALYTIPPHGSATINELISTAHGTLPRIDQIVCEALDDTHAGGGLNKSRIRVIDGTATGGATLDNRNGAAALPSSCMRLADVLVPALDTTITNDQIRDRRPWARGAQYAKVHTAGANITSTATTLTRIDTTNLEFRVECSGAPLVVEFSGSAYHSLGTTGMEWALAVDGVEQSNTKRRSVSNQANNLGDPPSFRWVILPTAGSHLFAPMWAGGAAGTLTLLVTAGYAAELSFRELIGANANNN